MIKTAFTSDTKKSCFQIFQSKQNSVHEMKADGAVDVCITLKVDRIVG